MDELIVQHRLPYQRELLTRHALHAVETFLRTRKPSEFEGSSWKAFRAAVLIHVAKMTFRFPGGPTGEVPGPDPLPECPIYQSQTFFRPYEKIGDFWVGGDWFGGAKASDGSLWVLVADVTGHGYSACLLASNLPHVWRMCWEEMPSDGCQPIVLLEAMHGLLADCLPEGIYVEGTLGRFRPDGELTVAPAGGSRFLTRKDGQRDVTLHKLKGSWLGLVPPDAGDQQTWELDAGAELLMGSDGLFDHIPDYARSSDALTTFLANANNSCTLFDAVYQILQEELQKNPPKDDITMVMVRRREKMA
jgi:serine phosphatase RsbU (regulator of sigma subunit)